MTSTSASADAPAEEPFDGDPTWSEGGCHCGAIRFRVRLRSAAAVVCNCSICRMKGLLHHFAEPRDFELLRAGPLTTYTFNTHTARHTFCPTCGVQPFYRARSHPGHVDVNLRCLDDAALIDTLDVRSFDGREWEANIAELRRAEPDE